MICERILGKLEDMDLQGKKLEYVSVEWHEAFKKIHRKVTDAGREVGIRLDDSVLKTGLLEGDVLYVDPELVIAVHTPPCEVDREPACSPFLRRGFQHLCDPL